MAQSMMFHYDLPEKGILTVSFEAYQAAKRRQVRSGDTCQQRSQPLWLT